MASNSMLESSGNLHLPIQTTPFIGRERELIEVVNLLERQDVRLATLAGPGGTGKTRLAIQAAKSTSGFKDGVFFVDLAPLSNPELVASTIARILGLREVSTSSMADLLLQCLKNWAVLLILDNFEHLMDSAALIANLIQTTADTKFLITSREALNLREEWLYPVGGMPYPTGNDIDNLSSYDAIRLFVEKAQRVRPDFSLADERDGVIRICQLVEGMPLAIELAASWTKTLNCTAIAAEIERNISFLAARFSNVPERHRSMQAVFDESWNQLEEDERQVFKRLAIFRGGFQRPAAENVAGASLPLLNSLVDKSLLYWKPGIPSTYPGDRYFIHELLRQFAQERLKAQPEAAENARDLHRNYFAEFLYQREGKIHGQEQRRTIQEIAAELENIRIAWRRAIDQRNIDDVSKATYTFYHFCDFQGRFQEGANVFEEAIEGLVNAPPGRQRDLALALLHTLLGYHYIRLGRFEEAGRSFHQGQNLLQHRQVAPRRGFGTDPVAGLGLLALVSGIYSEAISFGAEAQRVGEERGDIHNLQVAYYILAEGHFAQGQYDKANEYAHQAYALTVESGNRWMMAYILSQLGNVARVLGNYDQAKQYYVASHDIKEELEDPEGIAAALNHLGYVAWLQGSYGEAREMHQRSLAIYRKIGDRGGLARSLTGLGYAAVSLGDYRDAQHRYAEALKITNEINFIPLTLTILTGISEWLMGIGQPEHSVELLTLALENPASDKEAKERAEQLIARCRSQLSPYRFSTARKQAAKGDLNSAVATLLETLATTQIPADIRPTATSSPDPQVSQPLAEPLTQRELEVLALIADGLTNREIAEELVIAVGTVKSYTGQIFGKLGVRNRVQAVARARKLGLVRR